MEEWLVVDACDGTVPARTVTGTAAAGSVHVPHRDPRRMGLAIGEGQEGAPLRWGCRGSGALTVDRFRDEDRVPVAVSPSGERLLTVTHHQGTLSVLRVDDGSVETELHADLLPAHAAVAADNDDAQVFFDYEGGFVDENRAVVGTVESDEEFGDGRHWLVDLAASQVTGQIVYPFPVTGLPHALGDGTWFTTSPHDDAVHVWARDE
ncbi:hypothetical protein AB0442_18115 [Kitasatospora sp. NPDC085895]|uniref:hypothetical protein n=1 Tax=Kitasatospora sp. NPDC085895 TaxID=3155057 RepID=UPI0034501C99